MIHSTVSSKILQAIAKAEGFCVEVSFNFSKLLLEPLRFTFLFLLEIVVKFAIGPLGPFPSIKNTKREQLVNGFHPYSFFSRDLLS